MVEGEKRFYLKHSKWTGFVLVYTSLFEFPVSEPWGARGKMPGGGGYEWWAGQRKWWTPWPRWLAYRALWRCLGLMVWCQLCHKFSVFPHLSGILTIFSSSLESYRLCTTSVNSSSRIWPPGLKKWVLVCVNGTEKKSWPERIIFSWSITCLNQGWLCLKINCFVPENVIQRMCWRGKNTWEHFSIWFFLLSTRKLLGWPEKFVRVFPVTFYGKTQANFLGQPNILSNEHIFIWPQCENLWVLQGKPRGVSSDSVALKPGEWCQERGSQGLEPHLCLLRGHEGPGQSVRSTLTSGVLFALPRSHVSGS